MLQVCPVKGFPQGNFSFPLGGVRLITSHHLPAGSHPYHVGRIRQWNPSHTFYFILFFLWALIFYLFIYLFFKHLIEV